MHSFRPGPVPSGLAVRPPAWPLLAQRPPLPASEPAAVSKLERAAELETATEYLNQARLAAAEILAQAAAEAEAAEAEARRQGYAEGLRTGREAAEGEAAALREQAARELESTRAETAALRQAAEAEARAHLAEAAVEAERRLAAAREEGSALLDRARLEQQWYLDAAQDSVVELAVAAAVRLVRGQLAIAPASVVAMVRAGLRQLKDSDCTVRISPQDLPLLEAQRGALERELTGRVLTLQTDRTLPPGDYLVNSDRGQIDGTVEGQAELLRGALTTAMGRG